MKNDWEYLGDGVYAKWDGYFVHLHAASHEHPTDRIYLEPEILEALNEFVARVLRTGTTLARHPLIMTKEQAAIREALSQTINRFAYDLNNGCGSSTCVVNTQPDRIDHPCRCGDLKALGLRLIEIGNWCITESQGGATGLMNRPRTVKDDARYLL